MFHGLSYTVSEGRHGARVDLEGSWLVLVLLHGVQEPDTALQGQLGDADESEMDFPRRPGADVQVESGVAGVGRGLQALGGEAHVGLGHQLEAECRAPASASGTPT